jgi:hypothetical protein
MCGEIITVESHVGSRHHRATDHEACLVSLHFALCIMLAIGPESDRPVTISDQARQMRKELWEDYENTYEALSPIQQAVLEVALKDGDHFAPFTKLSREIYGKLSGETVDASAVQRAIEALSERGLIWKSARGQYALEDQAMREWFESRAIIDPVKDPI